MAMNLLISTLFVIGVAGLASMAWLLYKLRRRYMPRWLISYLRQTPRRRKICRRQPVHLLLCVADHFEPELGDAPPEVREARVDLWIRNYPRLFAGFRDSDGRPPRHTFFYPLEAYDSAYLDALACLCHQGLGEVEVHLHHDGDCAPALRQRLLAYKRLLADRHGLLARDRHSGELAYGFIHGNWALDNSRPDGRWCGVNNELEVLRQTGCYADFTMPSAPDEPTQTRKINSIYYACGHPQRPKGHDWGIDVGRSPATKDALLLIQGPLLLDWSRRKWGCLPRIENGCLQGNQPPTMQRVELWLRARVQVPSRPDWFFVKLHTHGCNPWNQQVLLGEPMIRFHQSLAERARQDANFHFHYVTAREMFNLVKAAEASWTGPVADALDYQLLWNGIPTRPEVVNHCPEILSKEQFRQVSPARPVLTKVNSLGSSL
jgi:hypothetical protein